MNAAASLQHMPGIYIPAAGVLGLIVGSFLNVVIHRLPVMLERQWRRQCRSLIAEGEPNPFADGAQERRFDLVSPPSRCPHCGHPVGALENIPVIS